MSMFDYDARPVTPAPVLVGTTASRGAYAIRDFLSRNGCIPSASWFCQTNLLAAQQLGEAQVTRRITVLFSPSRKFRSE